ncbi:hypothetical protein H310_15371 [Aphanomyces invadans]|uniref:Uncharacterized protein n=1 Tax=Aphanomyces invadans TaxID=157072 RepID=A0A024T7J9_9STRA|nr:hypothetical protein H310_15371 [Aphanomyces invadans]ETV89799.1 hypothetical protein H310_15371 [Aphanomyces invadans]|eukprot:XP_008881569.1 hypothetical protein H310_15371 [Aphanomyces invadans]
MIALQHEFEAKFWDKYHAILAKKGQSSRVDKKQKHRFD